MQGMIAAVPSASCRQKCLDSNPPANSYRPPLFGPLSAPSSGHRALSMRSAAIDGAPRGPALYDALIRDRGCKGTRACFGHRPFVAAVKMSPRGLSSVTKECALPGKAFPMLQRSTLLVLAVLLQGISCPPASAAEREDVRKVVNLVTSVKMPYPESLTRNRAKTERVWLERGG